MSTRRKIRLRERRINSLMTNRKIMGGEDYVTRLNLENQLRHNANGIDVTFGQYYIPEDRAASARHAFLKRRSRHIDELERALKYFFVYARAQRR